MTRVFGPGLDAAIPTLLVDRDSGFALFGKTYDEASCADATQQQAAIAIGTAGAPVTSVTSQFDG